MPGSSGPPSFPSTEPLDTFTVESDRLTQQTTFGSQGTEYQTTYTTEGVTIRETLVPTFDGLTITIGDGGTPTLTDDITFVTEQKTTLHSDSFSEVFTPTERETTLPSGTIITTQFFTERTITLTGCETITLGSDGTARVTTETFDTESDSFTGRITIDPSGTPVGTQVTLSEYLSDGSTGYVGGHHGDV